MTPEERLRGLRDRERFDLPPLQRRMRAPTSRPRVSFATIAAAALAVLVLVAVVVGATTVNRLRESHPVAPSPTVTETPVETPSPMPTPGPTAETIAPSGYEKPARLAGGDCSKFASDAQMTAIVGGTVRRQVDDDEAEAFPDVIAATILRAGGTSCRWADRDAIDVEVTVVPASRVPALPRQQCGKFTSGEGAYQDQNYCLVDRVTNGIRLSAMVYTSSLASSKLAAARLSSRFDSFASRTSPDVARPADAWPAVSCTNVHIDEVDGASFRFEADILGSDGSVTPLVEKIYYGGAAGACFAQITNRPAGMPETIGWEFHGDGAWELDERVAASEWYESSAPGFDRVIRSVDGYSIIFLRGPNLIVANLTSDESTAPFVAKITKELADYLDAQR